MNEIEEIKQVFLNIDVSEIVSSLVGNDIFIGFLALSLSASVLMVLRLMYRAISSVISKQFILRASFKNNDEAYFWLVSWLFNNGYHNKLRTIQATTRTNQYDQMEGGQTVAKVVMAPGDGTFLLFHGFRPFVIVKETGEAKTSDTPESITLITFGRSRSLINEICEEARNDQLRSDMVKVYSYSRHWSNANAKTPRPLETVIIDSSDKNKIVSDIEWFLESKSWYVERGIPYHRGYLFYGPPGTGKTSLSFALASHFGLNLCVLNPNSIAGDDSLLNAFSDAPNNSLILIEDIDTAGVVQSRKSKPAPNIIVEGGGDMFGITLSGLLNSLDGVCSPEGRIVVMTTNHKEKLDPALIRSGRIDIKMEIGLPSDQEKLAMFQRFYPDKPGDEFLRNTKDLSMADIQELLIRGSQSNVVDISDAA
jgi:chaperone BCS1